MLQPAGKILVRAIGAAIAAGAIVFAAVGWRLSQGPISLDFMTPYLADALSIAEAGFEAEMDDTVLAWGGWARTLDIRAVNFRLRDERGSVIAAVPSLAVELSVPSLLRGRIAPTSMDLIAAKVWLTRAADGQISMGFGEPSEDLSAEQTDRLGSFLDTLASMRDPDSPLGRLEHINILDASVTIYDRKSGTLWRARDSDLRLRRSAGILHAGLQAALDLGERLVELRAIGAYDGAGVRLNVRFENLEPAWLANAAPSLDQLSGMAFPVSGSVGLRVDRGWRLTETSFALTAGAGQIQIPDLHTEPVQITEASMQGVIAGGDHLTIEAASLNLDGFTIDLHGEIGMADGAGINLEGDLANLKTDRLPRYWPEPIAPNARTWILQNISQGGVQKGSFTIRLSPEEIEARKIEDDSVRLDFEFAGLSVRYFRPLPQITNARGSARLSGHRFEVTVPRAEMGDLAISEGKAVITDLHEEDQFARIEVAVAGSTSEVLGVLDRKPLGFISRFGIQPETVGGRSVTRAHFRFPLERSLEVEQIEFGAKSTLAELSIPRVADRFRLNEGAMTLTVDGSGLDASGTAKVNGVPLRVSWRQEFESKRAVTARYRLAGRVDDAGREALGFPTGSYVSGPVEADVAIDEGKAGAFRLTGRFGLAPAALTLKELGWRKEPGVPGDLRLTASSAPRQPIRIDNIVLNAAGLKGRGSVAVSKEGSVLRGELKELSYGENRVSGQFERRDSVYVAEVKGAQLNLRPFLDKALGESASGQGQSPSFQVSVTLDRAVMSPLLTLQNLTAHLETRNGQARTLRAEAGFPEGGGVRAMIVPEGDQRRFSLLSDSAAGIVRYLHLSNVLGGRFELDALLPDAGDPVSAKGMARMRDFKVTDAPVLARLLTLGSLSGINAIMRGEGIEFVQAEVPFSISAEGISIERARAFGPAIGISAEGLVEPDEETLNLSGTVVPAYTINKFLGNIPVLGPLIVGEGILGTNYRVSGPLADPQVTVNPLSTIAPGFLRGLFQAPEAATGDEPVGPEQPSAD